jgi:hypothetical protein
MKKVFRRIEKKWKEIWRKDRRKINLYKRNILISLKTVKKGK